MKKQFILFDFDGVIADTLDLAYEIELNLCPQLKQEEFSLRFNGNINDWEDPINYHSDDCDHNAIDFWSELIPRMLTETQIFPGMQNVIAQLEQHYTLIIISSSITSPIQQFLEKHTFGSHFDWVMGNDLHKSKVEKIKMVFDKYDITAEQCIFITDTVGDMKEANKMDVPAIAVTWGFQSREMLEKGPYTRIVDQPSDILKAVAERFA